MGGVAAGCPAGVPEGRAPLPGLPLALFVVSLVRRSLGVVLIFPRGPSRRLLLVVRSSSRWAVCRLLVRRHHKLPWGSVGLARVVRCWLLCIVGSLGQLFLVVGHLGVLKPRWASPRLRPVLLALTQTYRVVCLIGVASQGRAGAVEFGATPWHVLLVHWWLTLFNSNT